MSKFSSGLVLTDLNDYIAPSQACIKPVESNRLEVDPNDVEEVVGKERGTIEYDGLKLPPQPVSITLNDCLACSGCITSAESVLVQMQSHKELVNLVARRSGLQVEAPDYRKIVVSIAPQCRASIANKYNLDAEQTRAHLNWLFYHRLRVDAFLDLEVSRDISLFALGHEFTQMLSTPKQLPLLASACPGWICYAEKTHPELIPHLSTTKSPQQIQGSLIKSPFLLEKLFPGESVKPEEVYHLSIMPCYDKKLEASRPEFSSDGSGRDGTRDVDCVITTGEVEQMWREFGLDLGLGRVVTGFGALKDASATGPVGHVRDLLRKQGSSPGSSSGGYLYHVMLAAARHLDLPLSYDHLDQVLFKSEAGENPAIVDGAGWKLTIKQGRNIDLKDWILETGGKTIKLAQAYGFRNIQNLVRKVPATADKRIRGPIRRATAAVGKAKEEDGYAFVEVMACPGGCINGGGQLRPDTTDTSNSSGGWTSVTKEWVQLSEAKYRTDQWKGPTEGEQASWLYHHWLKDGQDLDLMQRALHATFKAVDRPEWMDKATQQQAALTVKW
jgi:iron only hydrogenase large subunit-like protein